MGIIFKKGVVKLNIQELKEDIKNKTTRSFYTFAGEEHYAQKIYIKKIAEINNANIVYPDSLSDIYQSLFTSSLLSMNSVYIFFDDKDIIANEKVQSSLKSIRKGCVVILILSKQDKRSKFYKAYKDDIVEFNPMDKDVLTRYINQYIDLPTQDCYALCDICENDLGRILLEVDKIKSYAIAKNINHSDAFKGLLKDKAIYLSPKDVIFDFISAYLSRNVTLTFDLLKECEDFGTSNLAILSLLHTSIKQLFQVQVCESNNIEKTTGLTQWQIKCANKYIGNYKSGELAYMLKLLHNIEVNIKTGLLDESIAIHDFIVNTI